MKTINLKFKTAPAYTLIELLTVIAIISVLIGVLVPSITRSLSKNKLASDVDVMRAKIEETRLLASSSQTNDTQSTASVIPGISRVGYYGIFLPTQGEINSSTNYLGGQGFYAIVRLSKPFSDDRLDTSSSGYCSPNKMADDALKNNLSSGSCLIERLDLTPGVSFDSATIQTERLIGFTVPSQQIVELYQQASGVCPSPNAANGYCWTENADGPKFNQIAIPTLPYFTLKYQDKTAKINVEPFTGKLQVTYN